jgi:hypothetical protein
MILKSALDSLSKFSGIEGALENENMNIANSGNAGVNETQKK